MTAVVIFAHGSSIESANESVRRVAADVARKCEFDLVEPAFLEQGRPDLSTAVQSAVTRGASRIVIVPYFLTLGLHLQRDLPAIVRKLSATHPEIEIRVTPPLDGHSGLHEILVERAREALAQGDRP